MLGTPGEADCGVASVTADDEGVEARPGGGGGEEGGPGAGAEARPLGAGGGKSTGR